MRDSHKIVMLHAGNVQPIVRIFNCAGQEISRFLWTGTSVVGMGWTADEKLLFVDSDGEIGVYNVHGERLPVEYSLGEACAQDKVYECVVYSSGIVALTYANEIWTITDLNDVRATRLPNFDSPGRPQCLEVKVSPAHGLEVILAVENLLISVDADGPVCPVHNVGQIQMLSVSPDNLRIAAVNDENTVVVLSSDFVEHYRFHPPTDAQPLQVGWCGEDFVVLLFEEVLMVFDNKEEYLTIVVDRDIQMVSELDSLRVFTSRKHFMLRKISQSSQDVLSTESDHAGRDLYLARQAYDKQDALADKMLRNIYDDLPAAIDACIRAASESMDITKQRDLLKTATYGFAFASGYPNTVLYETCQKLRVLNAIVDLEYGIPMTLEQLNYQSIPTLISRLTNCYHHLLASKICDSMELSQDEVLKHWACARISADGSMTDDEELKSIIVDKLMGCTGVKYATIATHAQEMGRKDLAKRLLEYEICAADQVPLLLKLSEDERALKSAIESGDTDLVYYAMFSLHKKLSLHDDWPQFYHKIGAQPQAMDLFLKYCKAKMPDNAKEIYRNTNMMDGEAAMCFDMALDTGLQISDDPLGEDQIIVNNKMEQIGRLLKEASILYSKTKKNDFQSRSCDDFAQLRKMQAHVDQSMGRNVLVGLSPVDTIKQCIRLENHKPAEDIKRAFNVPEKHFWWIKVKTLAEKGDWETLESFASLKKSPIGWEPFISCSMEHGAPSDRVERFIDRLPDSEEKIKYYQKLGLTHQAARSASNLQNTDLLTKFQETFRKPS